MMQGAFIYQAALYEGALAGVGYKWQQQFIDMFGTEKAERLPGRQTSVMARALHSVLYTHLPWP